MCFLRYRRKSITPIRLKKLEWWVNRAVRNCDDTVCTDNPFDTIPKCDGRTDGRTDSWFLVQPASKTHWATRFHQLFLSSAQTSSHLMPIFWSPSWRLPSSSVAVSLTGAVPRVVWGPRPPFKPLAPCGPKWSSPRWYFSSSICYCITRIAGASLSAVNWGGLV